VEEHELVQKLAEVDLFRGLSTRVLRRIAQAGREERFGTSTQVISEGESVEGFRNFSPRGVEMHVVLEGKARVEVGGVPHATLGPGDYFGELSLIDGLPRSADVIATGDGLRTFALTKWTFAEILDKHPEVAVPIMEVLCARLRAAEAMAQQGS